MISSIAYGPVPSRRLGYSLGINNLPSKRCSYSCIYCQLGRTTSMQTEPGAFYDPPELARCVKERVEYIREKGETIDYLTFVADGEPTLDINLGEEIELLRTLGIKIAIITNASLVWHQGVRQDLRKADWVSLKLDTVNQEVWHRINRPHRALKFDRILEGMSEFAQIFAGELTSETMLIQGINDDTGEVRQVAEFLEGLRPDKAYLAIPTRPPAERAVTGAGETALTMAYQIFAEKLGNIELLTGYEGNAFASTGNVAHDLLSITSVHPMREEAVTALLNKAGANWKAVQELIDNGSLVPMEYQGKNYYVRKLPTPDGSVHPTKNRQNS
jgi:wyosine [tRNA(Phe)-imidazoG37] synthetase (radical SAM superfamily)